MQDRNLFFSIPDEMILNIFSRNTAEEHLKIAQVSMKFNSLAYDCAYWNSILEPEFHTNEPGKAKQLFLSYPEKRLPEHIFNDWKGWYTALQRILSALQNDMFSDL